MEHDRVTGKTGEQRHTRSAQQFSLWIISLSSRCSFAERTSPHSHLGKCWDFGGCRLFTLLLFSVEIFFLLLQSQFFACLFFFIYYWQENWSTPIDFACDFSVSLIRATRFDSYKTDWKGSLEKICTQKAAFRMDARNQTLYSDDEAERERWRGKSSKVMSSIFGDSWCFWAQFGLLF